MIKNRCLSIICLFLFAFIPSCDKADLFSAAAEKNENILRFDVPATLAPLNPTDIHATGSTIIYPLLYSYLCVPDENGQLQPDLAESWTYDPEILAWTIRLRTDAFYHNGQPVTSKDVKYSVLIFLKNRYSVMMDMIKDVVLISDRKLCIYLKKNDPGFMKKIWIIEIMPQSDNETFYDNDPPVGSGPFRLMSIAGNTKVVLSANKNYYHGRPSIDRVVYYYQPDREKSWARLLAGETDIAFDISPKNFEIIKQYDNRFYFDHYSFNRYSIILYNTTDILFSDPRVRQALTHAIDREYIVGHFLKGFGKVACGPMGIDSPYHNPEVVPLSYDPKKSLTLLQQAGWELNRNDGFLYKKEKPFEFTMLLSKEFQVEKNIARYIKLCLNEIGIKMRIQSLPSEECYQKYNQNKDFQAALTIFTDGCYRPEYLIGLWSPYNDGKSLAGCFAHPEVTALFNQATQETDPVREKICFQKADALIASLQPGTFLFHKTAVDVMSKRFFLPSSLSLTNRGIYRLKDAFLVQK